MKKRPSLTLASLTLASLTLGASPALAQDETPARVDAASPAPQGGADEEVEAPGGLHISAFIDAYYAYDFSAPASDERPPFFYNFVRHNAFSVNMALLQASFEFDRVHGDVGLMAGDYAQYNLAHEPELLRHLFEGYAGLRIVDTLWLDAGVFGSHLGFESAISTRNLTLTRSLSAENSPYYLAGARLTWSPSEALALLLVVANGWQNIRETPDNGSKAVGTQVQYTPLEGLTLNWSTLISKELPDASGRWRYFNDLYAVYEREGWAAIAGFDIGVQERAAGETGADVWYVGSVLGRYTVAAPVAVGARVEYFHDPHEVIIGTPTGEGFRVFGYSFNVDVEPVDGAMLRVEARLLQARRDLFLDEDRAPSALNAAITTSLAIEVD